MNEHDDDLESTVQEGADKEEDAFPNTTDEFDRLDENDELESDPEADLDEDRTEL